MIRKGLDLLGVGLESLNIYLGLILLLALSTDRIRTVLSERKEVRDERTEPLRSLGAEIEPSAPVDSGDSPGAPR